MIRKSLAAAAALVLAAVVALTPQAAPTTTVAPAVPVSINGTQVFTEDDPAWDCHQVTAHSNGVCGSDLPEGFTVGHITECVTVELYPACAAAVRAQLGRQ